MLDTASPVMTVKGNASDLLTWVTNHHEGKFSDDSIWGSGCKRPEYTCSGTYGFTQRHPMALRVSCGWMEDFWGEEPH